MATVSVNFRPPEAVVGRVMKDGLCGLIAVKGAAGAGLEDEAAGAAVNLVAGIGAAVAGLDGVAVVVEGCSSSDDSPAATPVVVDLLFLDRFRTRFRALPLAVAGAAAAGLDVDAVESATIFRP